MLLGEVARVLLDGVRLALDRWRRYRGEVPPAFVSALAELPFLRDVPRAELLSIAAHL
ncbi:MAG: hypothetical protein H0V80_03140, partial [Acidobacteria bacterium]|nr:hypothetical protein [Acidobacteriota bacterium]